MATTPITILRDHEPQAAGLVWEEPPAAKTQRGMYATIAAALRERPNDWAILRTYPKEKAKNGWGFVGTVRSGKLTDFPAGDFEACARTVGIEVRVYIRYVGTAALAVAR